MYPSITIPEIFNKTKADYIYCEDCKMFVDFWKYDHDIKAAGHGHTNWSKGVNSLNLMKFRSTQGMWSGVGIA